MNSDDPVWIFLHQLTVVLPASAHTVTQTHTRKPRKESSAYLWNSNRPVHTMSIHELIPPPVPPVPVFIGIPALQGSSNIPDLCPSRDLKSSASSGAVVFSSPW